MVGFIVGNQGAFTGGAGCARGKVGTKIERKKAAGYAGDVTPEEAWRVLSENSGSQLVDVRSVAEWTFVGVPNLSELGKTTHCVEWQRFPGMAHVADFAAKLTTKLSGAGVEVDTPVFFLCRSGVRSAATARALTALGYSAAFNIAGGFEGDVDGQRHRAGVSGWKFEGLPWVQT